MNGRQKAMVLGAFLSALGTQAAWADDDNRAVPRGGGSDGGSSAGASHHASGGSSWDSSSSSSTSYGNDSSSYAASASYADDNRAVPRGGGSSSAGSSRGGSSSGSSRGGSSARSGDSSSGSSHSRPPQTDAQRRKPQPGTGTGYRHHRGDRYYRGYYGYPYSNYSWNYGYYWSPWYYPSYGGWYGGYGHYGYGPGYYGGGYHRGYGSAGSVRVMVEPRQTKVYVDDYYAGVADDFDGIFQRLNLSTGRHDISLRLDGYETHKVKLYVPLDHTIKIKHEMVRGSSEKVSESTVGDPMDEARYSRDAEDDYENSRDHRDETRPDNRGERGTVRLDVSPSDASIYVDGVFRGTGQDLRRVTLPEGTHRLEVVRPGYRTLERDIDVTAGEVEEVDVDLPRS